MTAFTHGLNRIKASKAAIAILLLIVVICVVNSQESTGLLVIILVLWGCAEFGPFRYKEISNKALILAPVLFTQLVLGLMGMYWIRMQPYGVVIILLVAFVVIANDILASIGDGSLLQEVRSFSKMAPKISQTKSWQGFWIGLSFGWIYGAIALVFIKMNSTGFPISVGVAIVLISPPLAVIGDLVVSATKRSLNIKDFGSILGTHGGLLDRIDITMAMIGATLLVMVARL